MATRRRRSRAPDGEEIELSDGRHVWVRPVRPTDIDELRRAIREADPETLRMRFLGGRPPETDEELRHLVEVDHASREALAAFDANGRGVAIARYDAAPGGTVAEFAVAVDPAWRRVGLATALLTRLARAAVEHGIDTVHVDYYATNRDVADLVRRSGLASNADVECGVVDAEVTIDPELLAAEDVRL